MKKIAIIGGGITGLTTAFYIQKQSIESGVEVEVTIFEKDNRLGGKIRTEKIDGYLIERGPDSFLKRKKEALELVEDLHLSERVISNQTGKSYILKEEELHPIPEGSVMGVPTRIKPLLDSGLLSMDGKARVLNDLFIPPLPAFEDISVGDFFKQRLGEEMVDHVISPLLSGIYAGNIYKLSLQIALPNFIEVEKRVGSLMLGLKNSAPKKATTGQFATLNSGLESLVDALVASFQEDIIKVQIGTGVTKITKNDQGYVIENDNGETSHFDSIVLSVPHQVTESLFPEADYLKRPNADPNTSVATIAIAFSEEDVHMSREGTGFVVSRREQKSITAATWTHMKWGHAAPKGKALIRCYVGKAGDDDIIGKSDDELVATALKDMSGTVEIKGEPDLAIVSRWPNAMPQYPVGHKQWFSCVNERLAKDYPGVYLAGASYDGVGIPDCIRQGKTAAKQIME
jgi:protoporphyrinogen/coproporphyrinogen III oxidase